MLFHSFIVPIAACGALNEADRSEGISADALGNIYIAGYTTGSLAGPNAGDFDAFLSTVGYPSQREESNPAYEMFLGAGEAS